MVAQTVVIKSNPGIKRDGTRYEGDFYVDGQWVRFQRGLPRKIGGFRQINKFLPEISRGFSSFANSNLAYCHSGSSSKLSRFTIDLTRNSSLITDRTPAALTVDASNTWMFQHEYDSSTTANMLIAHVAPNLNNLTNSTGGQIFAGDLTGTGLLTPITIPAGGNATGGIVAIHPYLFYFGSDGVVGWSVAGTPTDLSGAGSGLARPWGQKIIKGMPLRSGGGGPAALLWAYDAVIRASFSGGSTVFQFDVLASDTSIISPDSVVDYDGVFYWAGVDRFLMFNGVVREVPNSLNLNWFYDNVNATNRSKVFAFKNTRYGEIWWCYPRGDATECSHAVIYNVRENTWYDTELPSDGRTCGVFDNLFNSPLLAGATVADSTCKVWLQEQEHDQIDGIIVSPVRSFFETADLSALVTGQNKKLRISAIEPDFIQAGPMTVQVSGRANARAVEVEGPVFTFPEQASLPQEQIVMLKEQRRELRVRFESNSVGGDYQMGQIIGHIEPSESAVFV